MQLNSIFPRVSGRIVSVKLVWIRGNPGFMAVEEVNLTKQLVAIRLLHSRQIQLMSLLSYGSPTEKDGQVLETILKKHVMCYSMYITSRI